MVDLYARSCADCDDWARDNYWFVTAKSEVRVVGVKEIGSFPYQARRLGSKG